MSQEQGLGKILHDKGLTIAVAESITGGLIGDIITDVPGSSSYFKGGVIVYSNESKMELLGVKGETLYIYGAVSEQCALEMASGVRALFHTDIGVAVTGIAGPTGVTPTKPVGHVNFAYDDGRSRSADVKVFPGDRGTIKKAAAEHLIRMTLDNLNRL